MDALQTLFRAPLTPGVHPGGRNIAYDLALVKLGAHTKFGEDWSNGVDFYSGHTHTHTHTHKHTHRFNFIYKTSWGFPALPGSLFTNNKVYCVGKGGKVCEPQNMLGWIGISAIFTS